MSDVRLVDSNSLSSNNHCRMYKDCVWQNQQVTGIVIFKLMVNATWRTGRCANNYGTSTVEIHNV